MYRLGFCGYQGYLVPAKKQVSCEFFANVHKAFQGLVKRENYCQDKPIMGQRPENSKSSLLEHLMRQTMKT